MIVQNKTMFLPLFILIALVWIPMSSSYAQTTDEEEISFNQSNDIENQGLILSRSKTNTTGSPYLNDDFLEGHIMMNKNMNSNAMHLRYNIFENTVEFLRDDELFATAPDKINGFIFYGKDQDVVFKNGFNNSVKGVDKNTLFRVIYNGNTKLLARYHVTLNKNMATYGTATKEDKYSKFMTYYLVTSDGKFHELETPEKELMNILASHRKELKQYKLSNSLDLNKEFDLKKLLKYYDSLK